MAVLDDLLQKVSDPVLQDRLAQEIRKATKHKKFGLVFEEHLPECTPLYDVPVKKGSHVAVRDTEIRETFTVLSVKDGMAKCISNNNKEQHEFLLDNLVTVAEFGEPIYPYLETIDTVCNAPDSDLWHTLIEADNYHALQLLEYMYAGKVDCIYIDPPYNKEDSYDWKYNCNYVDGNDIYRHSKWLSMMERRLKLAKTLLNPKDSVLIVTIDEMEYLHLGMLLEQLFPDAGIQMVSLLMNPKGSSRKNFFSRSNEFVFFLEFGSAKVQALPLSDEWRTNADDKRQIHLRWADLMRFGDNGTRNRAPNCFYPILVTEDGKQFVGVGDSLPLNENRHNYIAPEGTIAIWPIHKDGVEGCWGYARDTLLNIQAKGYVKLGPLKNGKMRITYLSKGTQKMVEEGKYEISGRNEDGSIISETEYRNITPSTQWNISSHNSHTQGTELLQKMIGKRFTYPKSLYAVHDTIHFFIANKPNALIVDFFAGSGTTLHAVNLLNAEDGGNRRCIMVTNNEIGCNQENKMRAAGYHPGDPEWEENGIARYITWPRTVCSIEGHNVKGVPLEGEYITSLTQEYEKDREIKQIDFISDINALSLSQKKHLVSMTTNGKIPQKLVEKDSKYIVSEDYDISVLLDATAAEEWFESMSEYEHITKYYVVADNKTFKKIKERIKETFGTIIGQKPVSIKMSDGFKTNAIYFKLGFLDKNAVAFGRQFKELLGVLWMKAGAIGPCPHLARNATVPDMMILPQNRMAILIDDTAFASFEEQVKKHPEIETVYIVTDSDRGYREMMHALGIRNTYQLYRNYLDNFRINHRR